jgi:hypothetical protein
MWTDRVRWSSRGPVGLSTASVSMTADADAAIDPTSLADQPVLGEALQASGFVAGQDPGRWFKDEVRVDLMNEARCAPSASSASSRTSRALT